MTLFKRSELFTTSFFFIEVSRVALPYIILAYFDKFSCCEMKQLTLRISIHLEMNVSWLY